MRVLSVVGARPQFVKLAPMSRAFRELSIEHLIVHTGQHYDDAMSDAFFRDFGIPKPYAHLGIGSGSHGVQTGRILAELDPVLAEASPDWVLVYGDTNSTIAGALSAVKMHIPLAHLEAGLRSHNRAMPEEHNRVLADHAADLCLAPTEAAMEALALEGLESRSVLVGDVMVDVCLQTRDAILNNPIPLPLTLSGEPYLLATIHRAENTDDENRLRQVIHSLQDLPLPVVLPAHPRLKNRCESYGIQLNSGSIHVVQPLNYPEMIQYALNSQTIITDSGGLQKEAFILGKTCTTLRQETEWIETLTDGWNILDPDLLNVREYAARPVPKNTWSTPYGDGRAALTVARTLLERAAI